MKGCFSSGVPTVIMNWKDGDISSVDCGVPFTKVFNSDSAIRIPVGEVSFYIEAFSTSLKRFLYLGIELSVFGNESVYGMLSKNL